MNIPSLYKTYPNSKTINLPKAEIEDLVKKYEINKIEKFDTLLKARKSIRKYTKESLNLGEVSYLLWASTGIQRVERNYEFRTAPSAGALYPIETYISIQNVINSEDEKIENGIYHYSIKYHSLEVVKKGEFGMQITQAALGQSMCKNSAVNFIHTAIFGRSEWKYRNRAVRYILIDLGHIGQNLALALTALNLGGCHIGAFYDSEMNNILGVDGNIENTFYITSVGKI